MAPSQTFQDHIHEFRRRLFWVIGTIGISAGIAYAVRNDVIQILQKPLGAPLFYSSPGGGFNFVLKLSMIIGMFITLPVIIYQLLRFLTPALPIKIKTSTLLKIIGASTFLAAAGIAFGFYYMIPQSLHFFGGFSTGEIKPLISADSYLTYVINNLVTFALAFQIPLLLLFIDWIKPIKPSKLLKYQRHVIVGAFALALVLPFTYDPISQFMVAVPIIGLYYVSIVLIVIAHRRPHRKASEIFTAQPTLQEQAEPVPAVALVPSTQPEVQKEPKRTLQPLAHFLVAAANKVNKPVQRPRLSVDGMRGPSLGMRPQVAYARVAPQPKVQQIIVRTPASKAQPVKTSRRGFNIDGFIAPPASA